MLTSSTFRSKDVSGLTARVAGSATAPATAATTPKTATTSRDHPALPPGPIVTRGAPSLVQPFASGPNTPWAPDPRGASSFEELLAAAAASLDANGYALVVTPVGPLSETVNDEVRRVRSMLGSPRVVGTSLVLPPLGVAVVAGLALEWISGLSPGQAIVTVRTLAASIDWFAWVRHPRGIVDAFNLTRADSRRLSPARRRHGYLVACTEGLGTPTDDLIGPWPPTGARDIVIRNSPLVVSLSAAVPDTVIDTLETLERSTLTVAQPLSSSEVACWGTEKVACGVWIPEGRWGHDASAPTCGWCGEITHNAICPFCHHCGIQTVGR